MADLAFENFAAAGRDGAPQGYSWYGRGRELQPVDPEAPGANLADAVRFYKLAADKNYAPGLAWHGRALLTFLTVHIILNPSAWHNAKRAVSVIG